VNFPRINRPAANIRNIKRAAAPESSSNYWGLPGARGQALTLIDEAIGMMEENRDLLYMPEALRVKGNVLLSLPQHRPDDAEICFTQSLDWSGREGARAWELRTAIDLAALWAAQGQRDRARAILQPIFEQFVKGLDTTDLKAAAHL
jgi:hypothetical protein